MRDGHFSSKWGVRHEELATQKTQITACVFFAVVVLVLCLIRPKIVLVRDSSLRIAHLSYLRVVVLATCVVGLTYFYPALVSSM